jgi:hypothetical protein
MNTTAYTTDGSHHARYRLPYIGFMAAIATFVVARQYSIFKDHDRFISNRYAPGVFISKLRLKPIDI